MSLTVQEAAKQVLERQMWHGCTLEHCLTKVYNHVIEYAVNDLQRQTRIERNHLAKVLNLPSLTKDIGSSEFELAYQAAEAKLHSHMDTNLEATFAKVKRYREAYHYYKDYQMIVQDEILQPLRDLRDGTAPVHITSGQVANISDYYKHAMLAILKVAPAKLDIAQRADMHDQFAKDMKTLLVSLYKDEAREKRERQVSHVENEQMRNRLSDHWRNR